MDNRQVLLCFVWPGKAHVNIFVLLLILYIYTASTIIQSCYFNE